MMKENEDGAVHLVVGRTPLRCARGAVFGGVKDKKNGKRMVRVGSTVNQFTARAPLSHSAPARDLSNGFVGEKNKAEERSAVEKHGKGRRRSPRVRSITGKRSSARSP